MNFSEQPVIFDCQGCRLVGVLSRPAQPAKVGVLILVGGPQTRIGSHRQFALLARALATAGIAALRFDFRGMGDSEGEQRDFAQRDDDIAAATDAFFGACPGLQKLTLWGLCDAASAALLYWQRRRDSRLAGLALLNPWVRSDASLDQVLVRHYYRDRLFQPDFWRKLLSGGIPLRRTLGEAFSRWRRTRAAESAPAPQPDDFRRGMATALGSFPGSVLVILSGADLTAREFADWAANMRWRERDELHWQELADADHTFSSAEWRFRVEALTCAWTQTLLEQPAPDSPPGREGAKDAA